MLVLNGCVEICLSVPDPRRSGEWYAELLGMDKRYEHFPADGRPDYVCPVQPASRLTLCLVGHHQDGDDRFEETRTGLDHLEFLVDRRSDLDEWADRLDRLGIEHSGIEEPGSTRNAMLTFRDPDNIQLEFFWRAQEPSSP